MAVDTVVKLETRNDTGTAASRRLRHEGMIPAIVANQDGSTTSVKLVRHAFEMMLRRHASENMILDVTLDDGTSAKALLQEVQRDTLSGNALHADFTMISMTETLVVNVSVALKGEPVGVAQEDGILEQLVHELEVEGLADSIVDSLEADVSALAVGDSVLAGSVPIPDGLTLLTAADIAVATVLAPRVETETDTEEAEEGEEGEAGEAGADEAAEGEGDK
ncbi:MAG: 50S ribosomal protein L25 [Verrucomicrobia bacterium]|jgi:large subunit ribosomal protein L25|nr:50S ribosomal protein L25 [Verrucomicrobiota bacterium]MBT7066609.1 50S ribosomal protein L25 [Verrucomicrobiota bacterium]MBT7699765.1 50S ribosomal protein L25 [Verrucomicrobiota bacterium]